MSSRPPVDRREALSSPLDRLVEAILDGRFSVEVNREGDRWRVHVSVEPRGGRRG